MMPGIVHVSSRPKFYCCIRVKGSHHVFGKEDNPARISVPIHGKTPLKIGLLRHLMKLANIREDEL